MPSLPFIIPYDPTFLGGGFVVPMPTPCCTGKLALEGKALDYIYYSLVLHAERKTAIFTAHNVDGDRRYQTSRSNDWEIDRRAAQDQTGPLVYDHTPWDRGHLVRRDDLSFGDSRAQAQQASDATFFYSNAAPQHENFNQDEWLGVENWLLNKARAEHRRLAVFTGPLYTQVDIFEKGVRIPSAFWKVVVMRDPTANGDDLSVAAFLMKQNEMWGDKHGAQGLNLKLYQVGLRDLAAATGLDFGELVNLDEYDLRQVSFRARSRMRWIPISGPQDLRFYGERRRSRGLRATSTDPQVRERSSKDCGCSGRARSTSSAGRLADIIQPLMAMMDGLERLHQHNDSEVRSLGLARSALDRIVGGKTAQAGSYADCVCVGERDINGRFSGFCTGVLIAPRVVLTAAHCAESITAIRVGVNDVMASAAVGQTIDVERVIVHPDYRPQVVPSHDICVVILKADAAVGPVSIAAQAQVNATNTATVAGFGYNDGVAKSGFGLKRYAEVPKLVPDALSADQLKVDEEEKGYDNAYEFAAGSRDSGIDSCNGDSGGPIYVVVNGQRLLAGLTSRASNDSEAACGDGGIYTRVAPYLSWIQGVARLPAVPGSSAAGHGLRLSACLPNPIESDDGGKEWVELRSTSSAPVDLAEVELADNANRKLRLAGQLAPGATHRLQLKAGGPIALNNRGDVLVLFRNGAEIQREVVPASKPNEVIRFAGGAAPDNEPLVVDSVKPSGGVAPADWKALPC